MKTHMNIVDYPQNVHVYIWKFKLQQYGMLLNALADWYDKNPQGYFDIKVLSY